MKNATSLICAIGLLVCVGTSGAAQGFPDVRPTWGVARPTAYTAFVTHPYLAGQRRLSFEVELLPPRTGR